MIDLSTTLLLTCLVVPLAVVATMPAAPIAGVRTVAPIPADEWQLALIRAGRVIVLDTYAAELPCREDVLAYVAAVRSAPGWKPDATGHSAVICRFVGRSRRV